MNKKNIWIVEKNARGAWVIYGIAGVRQYYGHTKAESIELYNEECKLYIEVKD